MANLKSLKSKNKKNKLRRFNRTKKGGSNPSDNPSNNSGKKKWYVENIYLLNPRMGSAGAGLGRIRALVLQMIPSQMYALFIEILLELFVHYNININTEVKIYDNTLSRGTYFAVTGTNITIAYYYSKKLNLYKFGTHHFSKSYQPHTRFLRRYWDKTTQSFKPELKNNLVEIFENPNKYWLEDTSISDEREKKEKEEKKRKEKEDKKKK